MNKPKSAFCHFSCYINYFKLTELIPLPLSFYFFKQTNYTKSLILTKKFGQFFLPVSIMREEIFSNFPFKSSINKIFNKKSIYPAKLEIFNCKIKKIENLNFLNNLIILNLTKNAITRLDKQDFQTMKILQTLILNKNKLKFIAITFNFPKTLIILNLSFSNILAFPKRFSKGLKKLEIFDLSNSNLSNYYSNIFHGFENFRLVISYFLFNIIFGYNFEFSLLHYSNKILSKTFKSFQFNVKYFGFFIFNLPLFNIKF